MRGQAFEGERQQERCLDLRLWRELTEPEQEAAERLEIAARLLSSGLSLRPNRFEPRVDCAKRPDSEFDRPTVRDYFAWRRKAEAEGLDTAAVLSIVALGASLSEVDRNRRRRKGYARKVLLAGLALYCRQKGWPARDEKESLTAG